MNRSLETSGLDPAPGLLINRRPRRKIILHRTPHNTVTDHIPKAVEQLTQIMTATDSTLPAASPSIIRAKTPIAPQRFQRL